MFGDAHQSIPGAVSIPDTCRVVMRTDEIEWVGHNHCPVDSVSVINEFLFEFRSMDEDEVHVTSFAENKGLAGSDRNYLGVDAVLFFKIRQDLHQKSGIIQRCRRCNTERVAPLSANQPGNPV